MTDERRRNIKMVYGSLAYDLDTLARERQLEEAGEMPQRTAQPERQPQPQTRRRPRTLYLVFNLLPYTSRSQNTVDFVSCDESTFLLRRCRLSSQR